MEQRGAKPWLNALETPPYTNPSHSLQEQLTHPSVFTQAGSPLPRHTAAAVQGRKHQHCSSASHNFCQILIFTAAGKDKQTPLSCHMDEILSEQSLAAAEPLIGLPANCPFLGMMFFHLQAETRGQTLYFCVLPRLSKLSSK